VNPLASFLWIGGLILMAGGVVAAWPGAPSGVLTAPQARRRRIAGVVGAAISLTLIVAAIVVMWSGGLQTRQQAAGRPLRSQQAPDFTLELLDGSQLTLSAQGGQIVVVNFWATWCPPCEDELPVLQSVWEEYGDRGVVFAGIVYQDSESNVLQAIDRFGLTYPIGMDSADHIYDAYGATGVPETFIIDQRGRVAFIRIGPVQPTQLRQELDALTN
jgi:peroxiredoxin